MTRIFHCFFLCERWIPCQAVTSVLILLSNPETVHCSTKNAYTSEITIFTLPWWNYIHIYKYERSLSSYKLEIQNISSSILTVLIRAIYFSWTWGVRTVFSRRINQSNTDTRESSMELNTNCNLIIPISLPNFKKSNLYRIRS